jgi:hypothetical protein
MTLWVVEHSPALVYLSKNTIEFFKLRNGERYNKQINASKPVKASSTSKSCKPNIAKQSEISSSAFQKTLHAKSLVLPASFPVVSLPVIACILNSAEVFFWPRVLNSSALIEMVRCCCFFPVTKYVFLGDFFVMPIIKPHPYLENQRMNLCFCSFLHHAKL